MEMTDILYYGDEAKNKLVAGINKVADAVKVTMGPGGRNVILSQPSTLPTVTKDGVSVAKYIKLIDPIENMGAQLIRQVAGKTVTDVGDGTTTSMVLAQSIINRAINDNIINITEFRKGMDACVKEIIDYLESNKSICTKEMLYDIALTSSNGDVNIAKRVSEMAYEVGKEGIIEVKETELDSTSHQIENGYKFDIGLPTSYFINNADSGTCELTNGGYVLTIEDRLDNFKTILPLIKHAKDNNKFLIIIAKEFESEIIHNCQKNFQLGIPVVPVVAPGFGDQMLANLEDIANYCDTTVISTSQLRSPDGEVTLGIIDEVKISRTYTNLKSETAPSRVAVKIKQLTNLKKEATSVSDKDKISERISKLTAGFGIINVGGSTPAEIKEKFDRYEDSVGAVMASLKYGVLPGGGIALYKTMNEIKPNGNENESYLDGYKVVQSSCDAPLKQILNNSDIDLDILGEFLEGDRFETGVNAYKGQLVNMYSEGIVDPLKVTKSALTNAVSIAAMILTTGCVIDNSQINVNYE